MKLFEFVALSEEREVSKNISGTFKKVETKDGPVMTFRTDDDNLYVIDASVNNFSRFSKWNEEKATADIKFTGKYMKLISGRKTPRVQIKTEVKVSQDNNEKSSSMIKTRADSEEKSNVLGMSKDNEIIF